MSNLSPNPSWKPGDQITSPLKPTISIDPTQIKPRDFYPLMISAIVPRPIALVSTLSSEGKENLAPFSAYNLVSSNPATLLLSITPKRDKGKKDTLINIENTKQFVVCSVSEWMVEAVNHCSAEYPYGVSEIEKTGLHTVPSVKVKPQRIKESPIHFECELYNTMQIGDGGLGSAVIVVGKIIMMHVAEDAYKDGQILIDKIKPISKIGGKGWGYTTNAFDIDSPKTV